MLNKTSISGHNSKLYQTNPPAKNSYKSWTKYIKQPFEGIGEQPIQVRIEGLWSLRKGNNVRWIPHSPWLFPWGHFPHCCTGRRCRETKQKASVLRDRGWGGGWVWSSRMPKRLELRVRRLWKGGNIREGAQWTNFSEFMGEWGCRGLLRPQAEALLEQMGLVVP